jgi:hypothetical protein
MPDLIRVLVVAHPDDESMFFVPTLVNWLHNRNNNHPQHQQQQQQHNNRLVGLFV